MILALLDAAFIHTIKSHVLIEIIIEKNPRPKVIESSYEGRHPAERQEVGDD